MIQQPIREIHGIGSTDELICPTPTHRAIRALGMTVAGLSDARRGYRMHRPSPVHGHLLVCHGGRGRVWVNGAWTSCAEGQAYVSPLGVPSAFETVAGRRWQFAWVFFGHATVPVGLLAGDRSALVPADPRPLIHAVEGLYREGIGRATPALLDHWASLLQAYATRIVQPRPDHPLDPLWKLWAAVDARPATDWSIDTLADLAGMSGEALRRHCLRYVGRSPMQHVTHLRMQRADALLQSTSAKLSVIAHTVGYDNVFAFSTAFRRAHGVPPNARRNASA